MVLFTNKIRGRLAVFPDDFDESISNIKMETDVNEVILMESEALVEMVKYL